MSQLNQKVVQATNTNKITLKDIRTQIKKEFLENTWSDLENIPHYIIRNNNNRLTIIFQNRGQYDFANPRIVLFYGRNSLSEDTKQRNEKAKRKAYYGDMMNSKGQANITSSQFNNEHLNKEDQNSHNCPACDNCFDFCGDLRNKKAVPVVGVMSSSDTSAVVITDDQGQPVIAVPTNLKLKELETGRSIGNTLSGIMKDSSVPTLLFVVDGEHQTKQKPGCVIPAADPRRIPRDKDGYL
ncbi:12596_t:CDS:2 [Ambispora leptoticha]|uniref:12596_t:CDS:1 n=1 Tax=Ambispora leptoticha TaxID=144679 RepID=A0A9N9G387_9GLOM|nr:12596_t:CDS:2 [Ambispora leptoticha]